MKFLHANRISLGLPPDFIIPGDLNEAIDAISKYQGDQELRPIREDQKVRALSLLLVESPEPKTHPFVVEAKPWSGNSNPVEDIQNFIKGSREKWSKT